MKTIRTGESGHVTTTHVNLSEATELVFAELCTSTRLVILHEYQVTLRLHHASGNKLVQHHAASSLPSRQPSR